MSDSSRWPRRSRSSREMEATNATKPKPPIILGLARSTAVATHEADHEPGHLPGDTVASHSESETHSAAADSQQRGDKPIVVLRSRDDSRTLSSAPAPPTAGDCAQTHPSLPQQLSHSVQAPSQPRLGTFSQSTADAGKSKLAAPPEMKEGVKIIDENFRWLDGGIDWLVDQTDYLVVGVLGPQGCGKSTVLSLLAGNCAQDAYRNYIFQPENKDNKEDALHQTIGVDMFVSPERIIFLDTQPCLSPSLMDYTVRQEKKFSQEYTSPENYLEMQTLQLASFLMTVCHVIIVTQDWFADLTFLRSLLTAEMLKPHTQPLAPNPEGAQSTSPPEDSQDFYPTIMFVLNKATQDDFTPESYSDMKLTLHSIFRTSKLHYKGSVSMHKDNVISSIIGREKEGMETGVNLFLLPTMEFYKNEPESILQSVPDYRGFPSFNVLLRSMRNQLYAIPRTPISPAPLSERNWFHFAARTWDAVKKSQLIADYNRLMP